HAPAPRFFSRDQNTAAGERVEVLADHRRIVKRLTSIRDECRDLSQRIPALSKAGIRPAGHYLCVFKLDASGKTQLDRGCSDLPRKRRLRCIVELHGYQTSGERGIPPASLPRGGVLVSFGSTSGCSGVWPPPPKYRNKEASNQETYLDADLYPVPDRRGISMNKPLRPVYQQPV